MMDAHILDWSTHYLKAKIALEAAYQAAIDKDIAEAKYQFTIASVAAENCQTLVK